jgi:hypothetical protein
VEGATDDRTRRRLHPLQIEDGITGCLAQSAGECAARCLQVLADAAQHGAMALPGRERVRRAFPTPRLIRRAETFR